MRKTQFKTGEYYHLFNHGVDNRTIFSSKDDYDRFQSYLYILNDAHPERAAPLFISTERKNALYSRKRIEPLVAIGAYCLMTSHYHILATPLADDGIPRFMHKIQTAYAMFYNEKMRRVGRLFQGSYKSVHASSESYLRHLYAYIHLNPAKLLTDDWKNASAEELRTVGNKILAYPYSSAGEYNLGRFVIVNPQPFPKHFVKTRNMNDLLLLWLKYKSES